MVWAAVLGGVLYLLMKHAQIPTEAADEAHGKELV